MTDTTCASQYMTQLSRRYGNGVNARVTDILNNYYQFENRPDRRQTAGTQTSLRSTLDAV